MDSVFDADCQNDIKDSVSGYNSLLDEVTDAYFDK